MCESPDSQDPVVDPLHLDRCPDCGYLLTGLPEHGVCPECGLAYDREMIVLYGRPAGRLIGMMVPAGLPVDIMPIIPVALIALAIPLLVSLVGHAGLLIGMLTACVAGAGYLWRRRAASRGMPGPMQLRLCREGFALRRGLGPAAIQRWSPEDCIRVVPPYFAGKRPVQRYVCWIAHAEVLGFPSGRVDDIQVSFEGTAETAEQIRKQLRRWGRRCV